MGEGEREKKGGGKRDHFYEFVHNLAVYLGPVAKGMANEAVSPLIYQGWYTLPVFLGRFSNHPHFELKDHGLPSKY